MQKPSQSPAIAMAAAIVPLNTRFKGHEAADILLRSRAKVLCCVNGFLGTDYPAMLAATGVDLPDLRHIVQFRATDSAMREVGRGSGPPNLTHSQGWEEFVNAGAGVSDEARRVVELVELASL